MATHSNRNDSSGFEMEAGRLCDAAEAALKAVVEVAERNGGRRIYPTDIMTGPMHPACLNGFTRAEIDVASQFLVRMGWIDPRPAPRRAA